MNPLISVIIPVYNDPEGLKDTLNSLVKQEFEKSGYEIIIADNGSTDESTINVADSFIKNYPELVRLVIEDKIQSSYAARNKGINNSKGEIIVFIDADMKVRPDFLKKIQDFMADKEIKYAGFNVEMELKIKSIIGFYEKITGFKIKESITNKHFVSTNCLITRKDIFNKIGFFNSKLISGGDREFGNRVWNAGLKQFFIKDITVLHPVKDNIKSLCKRHFRLGRGIFQLHYLYPDKYKEILTIKYTLPERPVAFFNKMLKKKKIINFPSFYIIFFYFIKWILKIVKYRGYVYEKKLAYHQMTFKKN